MDTEIKDVYSSAEYRKTRIAYISEVTFEYFVSLLVTDAYLANLLRYMGIGDGMIGIISSLISFAFLFQLVAVVAVKHIVNVKRTAIFFHFASKILLFLLCFLRTLEFTFLICYHKSRGVLLCVICFISLI